MDTNMAVPEVYRPANRKSEVWAYFGFAKDVTGQLIEDNSPICKTCGKKVAAKGGNTTNLMSHLRDRHIQLFRQLKSKQNKTTTCQDIDCNIEPEPVLVSGRGQFRAKILALMESLMVKTTSEIVSIFDHIYMDTEKELIKKRKQVENLTHRLEKSERLCAQNVCHNQPDLKVERGEELFDSVLSYGQPAQEKTETVELSLECVVLKAEDQVNLEPAVQPYEYQVVLTNDQQLLLGSPVGAAGEAEDQVPPMEQSDHTDLETTASAAVAEQSFSESTENSTSAEQDPESIATPESNQEDLPPRRRRGRPPGCLESSSENTSSDNCSLVQPEDLNRTNEELLGSPVGAAEEAEEEVPAMEQSHQMDLETTASAADVAEQSSSISTEDCASTGQDSVASGVPESDQAVCPTVRRRGRSAGRSSSSPRRTLPLRSCTATSSIKSRPQETSKKLDSCGTNPSQYLNKDYSSVTEEAPNDSCSEPEIRMSSIDLKSKAVRRRTDKSKASENSEDYEGEDEIIVRSFEVKSEVIPRKKRRMMDPECKHDVNGALYPVEKILQKRTTADGQEEVRVKWSPCSSCGAKWRNSWEPA
ncbi:hypothetical protein ACEWY4_006876 [Coilia grayii]|uniref:BED-type domain-containing protein n=1 Tax=Coilia grayii TaxID=363190 RepID=A0ABD1KF02_9TELE